MTTTKTENKSKLIALAITSSLLLGSSGYLYYDNGNTKTLNEKQKVEINSLSEVKNNLLKDISLMKIELEQHKGKNKELNSAIASAQKEIKIKERRIKKLIRDNASISKLKAEAKSIKSLNEKHLQRIKNLEDKLQLLSNENNRLKSDNSKLQSRIEELEESNSILERKVSIASILRVENVVITGEKKTKDGKYAKSKLKNAYRFSTTFEVVENKVADPGEKTMYVRIIDSKGNLLQNGESGSFTNSDENLEIPYTKKFTIDYSNAKQKITVPVELNSQQLTKGNYTIEFYCEGHFSGLKKLYIK